MNITISVEHIVTVLMVATIANYLLSFLCLLWRRNSPGFAFMGIGWLNNLGLVAANWIVANHPPLGNMYHVMTFLSLCFLPAYLFLAWRDRMGRFHVYFVFVSALTMAGAFFMERDVYWQRVPALQSPWFVPHVVSYMVSYALAGVACALTVVKLARTYRLKLPDSGQYAAASYSVIRLAFPFMTFGLLSGALWAEEAWGIYWSWDPKETWSLITWSLYLIFFHCRQSADLRRHADAAQVLAFLALLTTFFVVNLLPKLSSALHSYA